MSASARYRIVRRYHGSGAHRETQSGRKRDPKPRAGFGLPVARTLKKDARFALVALGIAESESGLGYASPVCSGEVGRRDFRYGCEAKIIQARRGSLALDSSLSSVRRSTIERA